MYFPDLNFYAVLVATLVSVVIGVIWYSPKVLGDIWAKELGKKQSELTSSGFTYSVNIIFEILSTLSLAYILAFSGAETVNGALKIAGLISVVILAIAAKQYLFSKTSIRLLAIDFGYPIACLFVSAIILGYWL
jgi:sugar phosphate permease